jgi:hypothetical protein
MRWTLIFLLLSSMPVMAAQDFALGMAMESRAQREVNPDFTDMRNSPQLYLKYRVLPAWFALGEISSESRDSSSGSLHVEAHSLKTGLWGRYEFTTLRWTPFLAVGFGEYFDRVSTRFQSSQDTRSGTRGYMGTGVGVGKTYWDILLLEAEGRVTFEEQTKDPVLTAILRLGVKI